LIWQKELPRVPLDYKIQNPDNPIRQYGQNFFWLFEGINYLKTDPKEAAEEPMVQAYLGRVQTKYEGAWNQFISSNGELLAQIERHLFLYASTLKFMIIYAT